MAKYITKRLILAIVTIWAVATLTFFLMNLVPGGPFLSEKAISPQATVRPLCFKLSPKSPCKASDIYVRYRCPMGLSSPYFASNAAVA